MFNQILIANRGDRPHSGAAAKLNGVVRAAHAGDFDPMETQNV